MGWLPDETGLERTQANFTALTPLSFLRRAKDVFADHLAVVYKSHRKTYAEYADRVTRLASALSALWCAAHVGHALATVPPFWV